MPAYKNSFASPQFVEETILDEKLNVIGVIRIKPSGVSWKPKGQTKFYSVTLEKFTEWITNPLTKASRAKS